MTNDELIARLGIFWSAVAATPLWLLRGAHVPLQNKPKRRPIFRHLFVLLMWALLSAESAFGQPLISTNLTDKEYGLEATVVVLPPVQNRGFTLLDVPVKKEGDNIRQHWRTNSTLMCNGSFFDTRSFAPAAYCRVNGNTIQSNVSPRWSGLVAIDAKGKLSLLWRTNDVTPYPSVLQAGPYVIDPGGKIGIYSRVNDKARRTLVGFTDSRELIFIVTHPIDLYDLAHAIKKHLPQIERLLNLDGGPSTGFKTETIEILNEWPVRNYLIKQSDQSTTK